MSRGMRKISCVGNMQVEIDSESCWCMKVADSVSQKRALWLELGSLIRGFEGLICLLGDFNVVRRADKRNGCRFKPFNAADFNAFLRNNELQDVKQGGRRYTWVSWDGQKMSKLDRFLINKNFSDDWPDIAAVVGDRVFSDHCPVTLKAGNLDFGPCPFKLYDHWLSLHRFADVDKEAWDNQEVRGPPEFILKTKLKLLKQETIAWRKSNSLKWVV